MSAVASKKVLYLNWVASPYRVDFFNQLCKECNLKVIYFFQKLNDRTWSLTDKDHHYQYEIIFSDKHIFKGYIKLFKNVICNRYDAIILSGYSLPVEIILIILLKLFRRSFILNSDGGFINKSKIINLLKRFLIRSAQYWLSSGKNTTATLKFYGAKPSHIYEYHFTSVYRHEILTQPISNNEKLKFRQQLGIENYTNIIISIGQYTERKGMKYLIDAIHKCPDLNIQLFLIGEGPQRKILQEQIDNLGLMQKVILTGQKDKKQVLNYCLAADLFVLPSLEDIWGLVLNEALACGLPLIATSLVGAAYDLIENGENGFIVPPSDANSLKNAIIAILRNKGLRHFSTKSIQIAQLYNIETMASDHLALLNNLH